MGGSEPRNALYHVASGRLLAKYDWANCRAVASDDICSTDTRKKLNTACHSNKVQRSERAREYWIRNDYCPQRYLVEKDDNSMHWEIRLSPDSSALWVLDFKDAPPLIVDGAQHCIVLFTLRNKASGRFLTIDTDNSVSTGLRPDLWGWVRQSSAFSPGEAICMTVGVPVIAPVSIIFGALAVVVAPEVVLVGGIAVTLAVGVSALWPAASSQGLASAAVASDATAVTVGNGDGANQTTLGRLLAAVAVCTPADLENRYVR